MEEQDKNFQKNVKYTQAEKDFRNRIITEMEGAKRMRGQEHPEFDGMDYLTYWETNAKAANAYIPPKTNDEDIRATTGTTLEKKNTLLTATLNLNLDPDIEAYDSSDMMVDELGTHMEDMIRKSRKIENYDAKRINIYDEFYSQGTAIVEDKYDEYAIPQKELDGNFGVNDMSKMTWKKRVDKIMKECSTELIIGPNFYVGNIHEPDIQRQPFIFIRRLMTYEEAKARYGDWERFKYVTKRIRTTSEDADSIDFNNWTLEEYQKNMVEEVRYMNRWSNDLMILLNGVMMFPVEEDGTFPLSSINGTTLYPVAVGRTEPITNFFYGKSIPAKTKVDQALFDEMMKSIVLKTRKSYMPPLANNTGQTLSKRVFWAGHIEDDINPERLQPIGDNTGVSQAEFNATQFIKTIIDQKSIDPIMQGQSLPGTQTAREIVELKEQSMMRMGLSILGVVLFEKQLCYLRLYNILHNWTQAIEPEITGKREAIYRTISIDTTFEDGLQGERVIDFTTNVPSPKQVAAEDKLKKATHGRIIRKTYINPEMLRSIEYKWYIEITPTEKKSNALKQAQFEESVTKAIAIFGPYGKLPNLDYVTTRWAHNAGEDPNRFWQQNPTGQMIGQQAGGAMSLPGQQKGLDRWITNQLTPNATQRSSVANLTR